MLPKANETIGFGDYRLDRWRKLLWRGNEEILLPPKVFDVLAVIVEARGETVSKSEIMDAVWPDSFVEESNLTQNIYTLRRLLDNGSGLPSVIETVPRRGFRLGMPVSETASEAGTDEMHPSPTAAKRRLEVIGAISIVVLAVTLAAAFYVSRTSTGRHVAPVENVAFKRLTFTGTVSNPVISPDGKTVAFISDGAIHVQDLGTDSIVKITVSDHSIFGNLRFSLDGLSLIFRNERRTDAAGDVFQVSRFGGAARRIAENSWSGIGLSPDGKAISFIRFYPAASKWVVYVRDIESGTERALMERILPLTIYRTGFPDWSPDGKRLSVVVQEPTASAIHLIDVDSARFQRLATPKLVQIEQTLWEKDGKGILLVGRENDRFFQLWQIGIDDGQLRRITNDLNIYRHISQSADGDKLIAEQQTFYSHLWIVDNPKNREPVQLTNGKLSRDGNAGLTWGSNDTIYYSSRITGNVDLWSLQLSGPSVQLTNEAGNRNENPVVDDSGNIYFSSTRSGKRHIWRVDSNGGNPAQISGLDENAEEDYPAVTRDGEVLYFIQKSNTGSTVVRHRIGTGEFEPLVRSSKFVPERFLRLSGDGQHLAFGIIADKDGDRSDLSTRIGFLRVSEPNDITVRQFPRQTTDFEWAPDGGGFFLTESDANGSRILFRPKPESISEPLFIFPDNVYRLAVSRDGSKFAVARGKTEKDAILLSNFR